MGDRTSRKADKVPVKPGFSQLHWMNLTNSVRDLSGRNGRPPMKNISMKEVSKHNSESDAWTVLNGKVYNITPYIRYHPGGIQKLMLGAGRDCTDLFNEHHIWVNGQGMLEKCYLGDLEESTTDNLINEDESETFALNPISWSKFKIASVSRLNESCLLYGFTGPKDKKLGLKFPCQHLLLRLKVNGVHVERPYTPVNSLNQQEIFELIVKIYPSGLFSQALSMLNVGDYVEAMGPRGSFNYIGNGAIVRDGVDHKYNVFGMVAGGTGITPMLQLIRSIFENSQDTTEVSLVVCYSSDSEIIAHNQLKPICNSYPDRFSLHYVLSSVSDEKVDTLKHELGSFEIGRISKRTLEKHLPEASSDVCVFQCGPDPFDTSVQSLLTEIGFLDYQICRF